MRYLNVGQHYPNFLQLPACILRVNATYSFLNESIGLARAALID